MANISTENINTLAQVATSLGDGDYIYVFKSGSKTFSRIEKSLLLQGVGGGIDQSAIVNGFNSGDSKKVLSAAAGKKLKENVDVVQANVMAIKNALANLAYKGNAPTLQTLDWAMDEPVETTHDVSVVSNLQNCSISGSIPTTINDGGTLSFYIVASTGYTMSGVTAVINGQTGGTVSQTNSGAYISVVISNVVGDVSITVSATAVVSETSTPTLVVSPASLGFNATVGTPVTKTFTVTGSDLTGDVVVAVSGTGFSVDKTSISRTTAENGTAVTVTYNPSVAGTHSGSVVVSSNGATSKTIALSGTATAAAIPTINVSPSSLMINGEVDAQAIESFVVTGSNLTGNLTIEIEMDGVDTPFVLSSTRVTVSNGTANKTINVYFTPTAAGTYGMTLTISGGGAQSKTVTVTAVATEAAGPLKIVRGYAIAEDKAIRQRLIYEGEEEDTTTNTYKWMRPRKPFDSSNLRLNGSGVRTGGSISNDGVATGGAGTTGNTIATGTEVCYTDYIQLPHSDSATALYYGHVLQRSYGSAEIQVQNIFVASIRFYQLVNGEYVPIWGKGTQQGAASRTITLDSSIVTGIRKSVSDIYVRASFVMNGDVVDTGCCLRYGSASGELIWSAADNDYTLVSEPFDEPE